MNSLCYLLPYPAEETLVIELNVRVMDQVTEEINEVSDTQNAQPESFPMNYQWSVYSSEYGSLHSIKSQPWDGATLSHLHLRF